MEKTIWHISKLRNWDKNPRAITKDDFERLKRQFTRIKEITGEYLYKPLVITPDGEVLGGNMRLRILQDLGIEDVWVSIVNVKTEEEKIEIAISDNDRAGYYIDTDLAELINGVKINLEDYKVDLSKAVNLQELLDNFSPTGNEALLDKFDAKEVECPECGAKFTP